VEDESDDTIAWIIGGALAFAATIGVVLWRREVHAAFDRDVARAATNRELSSSTSTTLAPAQLPPPNPAPAAPARIIQDSMPSPAPLRTAPPSATEKRTLLINRLRSNEEARENFAFQSLLWSWEYTNAVPDGVMGQVTRGLIKQINMADNPTLDIAHASDRFDGQLMNRTMQVLINLKGHSPNRLLPFTLPIDVVHAVNTTFDRLSPNIAVLQVAVA
jgi:hypothetical protein